MRPGAATATTTDSCVACRDATCGDGFVLAGVEQCDDANRIDADSCMNDCRAASGDAGTDAGVVAGVDAGTDGGSTGCDGCRLFDGSCVPLTATTVTRCGAGGALCVACSTGQTCMSGDCRAGDAGSATGVTVGSACVDDSQCAGLPISGGEQLDGVRPFCKKASASLGMASLEYKNGYCTKRCLGSTLCGFGNQCGYFLGFAGELENICLDGCWSSSECRAGYACLNLRDQIRPFNVCYPLLSDGGVPGPADAGAWRPAAAGEGCTDDSSCQPPDTGQCLSATPADGGAAYPGGQCTANCGVTLDHSFCGEYGACDPTITTDSLGPLVSWTCFQQCSIDGSLRTADGGQFPACRPGYRCAAGTSYYVCVPQ